MHLAMRLATQLTINPNMPGASPTDAGVPGFITNFYSFALMMAGILAFGAIVWGGIKYATGRGNPSAESDGKSWITNALLGLLLLAGAYIILRTINPQLVALRLAGLPQVEPAATTDGTGGDRGNLPPPSLCGVVGCTAGQVCQANAVNSAMICVNSATKCTRSTWGACPSGNQCVKTADGSAWNCLSTANVCVGPSYGACALGSLCQRNAMNTAWACISANPQCGGSTFGACPPAQYCTKGWSGLGSYNCKPV